MIWPCFAIISVGTAWMPAALARSWFASMSTLPKMMSGFASLAASNVGPNARHGPHHVAQKSTNTRLLSVMVFSKSCALS